MLATNVGVHSKCTTVSKLEPGSQNNDGNDQAGFERLSHGDRGDDERVWACSFLHLTLLTSDFGSTILPSVVCALLLTYLAFQTLQNVA